MKIAVITGASSGMGRTFVEKLDKQQKFDEIWVIARRKERLLSLQENVSAKIRAIALDLTDFSSYKEYEDLLKEHNPTVQVLVNASGFGRFGANADISLKEKLEMCDLNDKAMVAITDLTLPYIPDGAEIYQIGSLSSFQPVPYIGVYAATKAFVLSYSRSLNVELKKRGIKKLKVLYSEEIPMKVKIVSEGEKRSVPGSNAFCPPAAGLIIASEVVKDIIKKD